MFMKTAIRLFTSIIFLILFWNEISFGGQKVFFYHTDPAGTPLVMTDEKRNVVWRADYKPFGEEYLTAEPIGNDHKFVGKEQDQETGLYYFGARYMEPMVGRFISPDPVGAVDSKNGKTNEKNILNPQRLNYYAYALNNPHKWVDFLGLAPGDPYPSQDKAARDAISDVNPKSIQQRKEYGGMIYKNPDGSYSYTKPNEGTKDSVNPGGPSASPKGTQPTGYYHTHGENDPGYDNENFSTPDKNYAHRYKIDGYLGTPSGALKEYKYSEKKERTIGNVPIK
jgi:RHS repeat-associated protein